MALNDAYLATLQSELIKAVIDCLRENGTSLLKEMNASDHGEGRQGAKTYLPVIFADGQHWMIVLKSETQGSADEQ